MMYCCCCSIWGSNYKTRLKHLIVLQNRLLRVIANVSYYAHTTLHFLKYGCLKFEDLVKHCTNKILFKETCLETCSFCLQKVIKFMYVTRQK